jgi:hypothetical protein
MLPLLTRYDEYLNNTMHHALRATFNSGAIRNNYTWPGRHYSTSGSTTDGIPFGARLRLKASWYTANAASFSGAARTIVDTMYHYGIINSDVGGMLFLEGTSDSRWGQTNLMTLQNIPSTAFEVVKLTPGWTITGPTCVQLGQTATYSIIHPWASDSNYRTHIYPYEDGVLQQNMTVTGGDGVILTDGTASGSFTYTPVSAGTHTVSTGAAGSGDGWLPPSNASFPVTVTSGSCSSLSSSRHTSQHHSGRFQ